MLNLQRRIGMRMGQIVCATMCMAMATVSLAEVENVKPLVMGKVISGRATPERPAVYRFKATEPGGLAIMIRGSEGHDLSAQLIDSSGQVTTWGYMDGDWYDQENIEQNVLTLGEAGVYLLKISNDDDEAEFKLTAALLQLPEAALPPDSHGRPDDPIELKAGVWAGETIRPKRGDWRDWYRFDADRDGIVTAVLRGDRDETDMILSLYGVDDFSESIVWASDDDQGNVGWESVTTDVKAGKSYYLRVNTDDAKAGDYRIMIGYVSANMTDDG